LEIHLLFFLNEFREGTYASCGVLSKTARIVIKKSGL